MASDLNRNQNYALRIDLKEIRCGDVYSVQQIQESVQCVSRTR
jgi:hypothetical protein